MEGEGDASIGAVVPVTVPGLPGPTNPMDIYLVLKNVMKDLDLEDLASCWSVNGLFRDVAHGLYEEKNPPLELGHIKETRELINELERPQVKPFPTKFEIKIPEMNTKLYNMINELWTRFGWVAKFIDIKFNDEKLLNLTAENLPGVHHGLSILALGNILEYCDHLEQLFVKIRHSVFFSQELAGKLPTEYTNLKDLHFEYTLPMDKNEGEMDIVQFLIERSPALQNLRLVMGHRFISARDAHALNRMLPGCMEGLRSRTTVELWLVVSILDEELLLEMAKGRAHVIGLRVVVKNGDEWTPSASNALGKWLLSLRQTLTSLHIMGNCCSDLKLTRMVQLKDFRVSLMKPCLKKHVFSPKNFPALERIRFGTLSPYWSLQSEFRKVKELNLAYCVDTFAEKHWTLPFNWTKGFPNVDKLIINLRTYDQQYGAIFNQMANVLDGFQNVHYLELENLQDDYAGNNIFKLLTGYNPAEVDLSCEAQQTGYTPKGALYKLSKLKVLKMVRCDDILPAKALLFASVNGGICELDKITFVQWEFDSLFRALIGRLCPYHEEIYCIRWNHVQRQSDPDYDGQIDFGRSGPGWKQY